MPNYISKGTETISSGGTLFNPYVLSSGVVIALGGGVVSSAYIYSGGREYVSSGGVDYDAYVYSGGGLRVYSSGTIYNPYVNSQAGIDVWGGRVFGGAVGAKGTLEASGITDGPKGYISAVRIISGGNMVLGKNGVGSAISVESGYLFVSSGGYLQESYVGSGTFAQTSRGAECYVDDGGLAHLTYVHSHGMFIVRAGGSATATKVFASGSAIASSGGLLSGTTAFGGVVDVKSGGSAVITVIQKDGSRGGMYVSDGAVARNTVIDSGASMYVLSGGVAAGNVTSNTVKNGYLSVNGNAFSFNVLSGGKVEVGSTGKIDTFSLNGGSITVLGLANENFYNSGRVIISGGSSISDMISGGSMDIKNRVISGSSGSSLARGYAEKLMIEGATAYLYSGCAIVSATVSSGGELFIYSSAHAGSVDVKTGGEVFVKSGGYLDSGNIYGSEWIASGGSADHLNVLLLGYLDVEGRTQNCKVSSGGTVDVTGAFINGSAAAGAKINVISNGTATIAQAGGISATASKGGILEVSSGTIRFGELKGGYLTLSSGAFISSGVVSSGLLDIGSNCSGAFVQVSGFELGPGSARLLVAGGGKTSKGDILGSQADLQVFSNGFAGSMNIYSGASAIISGTIDTCFVSDGGKIFVSSGGVASRTTIGSGGSMMTVRGAVASITVIGTGGELLLSSGTANTVNINGGLMTVSFGSATDCHVREGGRAIVQSLGIITGIVESGGTVVGVRGRFGGLTVSSGGKFTGTADLRNSSQVLSFASGGIMDFDISEKTSSSLLIQGLNNAANVSNAVYTLTVSDTQNTTTYQLADGAADFNKTISVMNTAGTNLGTLSLGNKVRIGNYDYTLNLSGVNNVLSVTVEAAAPAPTGSAKSDINGNGISDVMFQLTTGEYAFGQIGFWLDGTNEWQSQMAVHPTDSWNVLGAYDMNANGKADAVLVGNIVMPVGGVDLPMYVIGYYTDSVDLDENWNNISYLGNPDLNTWENKIGNLTGNAGKNSIIWHSTDLGVLGVWTDGTDNWISLGIGYKSDWKLVGCGDFNGNGKDSVLMSFQGAAYYTVDIDGAGTGGEANPLTTSDANWVVSTIGDFSGDGKDDIIAYNAASSLVAMWGDGDAVNKWSLLGMLDKNDWFIIGAGDYNGDSKDDLLVRQKSTGMLGYYASGNLEQWNVLGYGVDMNWSVIA